MGEKGKSASTVSCNRGVVGRNRIVTVYPRNEEIGSGGNIPRETGSNITIVTGTAGTSILPYTVCYSKPVGPNGGIIIACKGLLSLSSVKLSGRRYNPRSVGSTTGGIVNDVFSL